MSDQSAAPNHVTNLDDNLPSTMPVAPVQPVTYASTNAPPIPIVDQSAALSIDASTVGAGVSSVTQSASIMPDSLPPNPNRISAAKSASQHSQHKWDEMYQHLLAFKEQHGHCLVPNRYKENPQLGSWVSTQRRQYKSLQAGKNTPLTKERAEILQSIGFVWATRDPRHVPWEQRYQELMDYKTKHGDCLVPIGYKENIQLSNWVSTQRQEYKLMRDNRPTRLTEERIRLLNEMGFVWEAQRGGWRGKRKRQANSVPLDSNALDPGAPIAPHTLAHVVAAASQTAGSVTSALSRPAMVPRVVTQSQSFAWRNDAPAREVTAESQGQGFPVIQEIVALTASQQQASSSVVTARITSPPQLTEANKESEAKDDGIFADADEEEDWSPWRITKAEPPVPLAAGKIKADDGQTGAKSNNTCKDPQTSTCDKKEAAAALLSVGVGKKTSR